MYIPYKLLAVAEISASESGRYALDGLCIERDASGNPVIVATNGYSLLSARWKETPPNPTLFAAAQDPVAGFSTIVPCEHALRMIKFINKKAVKDSPDCGTVVLDEFLSGDKVMMDTADGSLSGHMESQAIKLPFPDWRKIIPTYTAVPKCGDFAGVRIAVSPQLLADLLDAMDKAAPSTRGVIMTVPTNPTRPILLERVGVDGERLLGILMPVNDDTLSNESVAGWNWDTKPTAAENESGGLGEQPPKSIAEQVVADIKSGKTKFPKPTGDGTTTIEACTASGNKSSVTLDKSGVVV